MTTALVDRLGLAVAPLKLYLCWRSGRSWHLCLARWRHARGWAWVVGPLDTQADAPWASDPRRAISTLPGYCTVRPYSV
jgi:hypothetical protein